MLACSLEVSSLCWLNAMQSWIIVIVIVIVVIAVTAVTAVIVAIAVIVVIKTTCL